MIVMKSATSTTGSAYLSGESEITQVFENVRAQYRVLPLEFCGLLCLARFLPHIAVNFSPTFKCTLWVCRLFFGESTNPNLLLMIVTLI